MTPGVVRSICTVLAVLILACIIFRRKKKTNLPDNEDIDVAEYFLMVLFVAVAAVAIMPFVSEEVVTSLPRFK